MIRQHQHRGQSLVEMAFVGPLLLLILFGIIDFGWYIYSYATIYQAARNGSERASDGPPMQEVLTPTLNRNNKCVCAVLDAMGKGAVLFPDLTTGNAISITYPYDPSQDPPPNIPDYDTGRLEGLPVEVHIEYSVEPLTPLMNLVPFGNGGVLTMTATSRRTIQNLGKDLEAQDLALCSVGNDRFALKEDGTEDTTKPLPPCHTP